REHGLLDRVLLIYEEGARKLSSKGKFDVSVLRTSAEIVRDFIESYHEKLEEEFLFTRLLKANREVELVVTLKVQHEAGRKITTRIISLAEKAGSDRSELIAAMKSFTFMYRPHAAREDTILFPAFKEVVGKKEYQELGDQFEEREHKLFGKDGFEGVLAKVAGLEKQIGIYDLSFYTPKG
ncbi:MAG: hemerythrin domain-containing protein, partial [Bdellovibrionota bacterium]